MEIPHWANICNLDGFPGASLACPHYSMRKRQLFKDGAYEAGELSCLSTRVTLVSNELSPRGRLVCVSIHPEGESCRHVR